MLWSLDSTLLRPVWLALLLCAMLSQAVVLTTRGVPPVISSVTPSFGSVEGGTEIEIIGANFLQVGLFTNRVVYIDNAECKEIAYYTTDTRLICVTPKCISPICRSSALWSGDVRTTLSIYVQTAEGILSGSSSFWYNGYWTPAVFKLPKYIRGNSISHIEAIPLVDTVDDMKIKIGDNAAFLGDPNEINVDTFVLTDRSRINYKPPQDMEAGFYNLSFSTQNDQSKGSRGTGLARMFPNQRAYPTWRYPYGYNFDASMTGTVFTVALQPSINEVSPASGSIGGGTLLTIRGSGFSKDMSRMTVLAAGRPCEIVTADYEEITCITQEGNVTEFSQLVRKSASGVPSFLKTANGTSLRNVGSSGWWVKMWSMADFQNNRLTDPFVDLQFAFKNEMSFSFMYWIGSNWPSLLGYSSGVGEQYMYAADFNTVMTAPISGFYRFYMSSDDNGYIYGNKNGAASTLILSTIYRSYEDLYSSPAGQMSGNIYLNRGERYNLRVRLLNGGGTYDFLQIGLRIMPNYNANGTLSDLDNQRREEPNSFLPALRNLTSKEFLHHHALRDVQVVSLSIKYQLEVQVRYLLFSFLF